MYCLQINTLGGFCRQTSECKLCTDCLTTHFRTCILEKHARDMKCPQCQSPENLEDEDVATRYFTHLNLVVSNPNGGQRSLNAEVRKQR